MTTWPTRQLAEFLAAVSGFRDEASATRGAAERAAEALGAEVAAILQHGQILTVVGFPGGQDPAAELAAVAAAGGHGRVELPGLGPCRTLVTSLDHLEEGRMVLARSSGGFSGEEADLARGMGRVLALTAQMLRGIEEAERRAVEVARLNELMEERQRLLERLSKIQRSISTRAPLDQGLDAIVRGARELVGDGITALRLLDSDDPAVAVLVASTGVEPEVLKRVRRGPAGHGVGGRAIVLSAGVVSVGASVGIAISQPGDDNAAELLRNADIAMYRSKADETRRCTVFEPAMGASVVARMTLEADLQRAINVNLSSRQLAQPDVVAEVAEVLAATRVAPTSLIIEITETTLMRDTEATLAKLRDLKALGIRLAVDDFGTGYSSLGYLRRFPFDVLKLDKSFVDGVAAAPEDAALCHAVIRLGEALKLTVVAEGIEAYEQAVELHRLGCDLGQGYYFARPMTAETPPSSCASPGSPTSADRRHGRHRAAGAVRSRHRGTRAASTSRAVTAKAAG